MNKNIYIGKELELFGEASKWKAYFTSIIKPFLKGNILEVGAGIGTTTSILCDGTQDSWLCLEPDEELYTKIAKNLQEKQLPMCCEVYKGSIETLEKENKFNAIVYIDVLEHIRNDTLEVHSAARYLVQGGYLIILAPAHQWLMSEFDNSIGHFRRYSKNTISSLIPASMMTVKLLYLDSFGLFLNLANKLILRNNYPNKHQIYIWDKYVLSISRIADRIIGYTLGKSVLGIWKKK